MLRLSFCLLLCLCVVYGQKKRRRRKPYRPVVHPITQEDSKLLIKLLNRYPEYFSDILEDPDKYQVQIIFTQINRDKYNRPYVWHHTFHLDTTRYFFPASMVKLPVAALALEKINRLRMEGYTKLTPFSRMESLGSGGCLYFRKKDPTSPTGYPYIAHEIKKVFLVSDNPAYDRLYDFVTPCEINRLLHQKGYGSATIIQRYGRYCTYRQNMQTPRLRFYDDEGNLIYEQAPQRCNERFTPPVPNPQIGKAHWRGGKLYRTPMDCTYRNYLSLKDLHEILMAIVIPQAVPKKKRFLLTPLDYKLLHRYMSMYPTESKQFPNYQNRHPTLMKYLVYGSITNYSAEVDSNVRIFNKVGLSFGYVVDCAYIVDFKKKVEFLVSAVIYANRDGVVNDGMYDYYTVGYPFMKYLGQVLLELERHRRKRIKPKLRFYQHDYQNEAVFLEELKRRYEQLKLPKR